MAIVSRQVSVGADVANFFWEGSALGPIEVGCVASFLKQGFRVRLYSYRQLDVPLGVELRDASEILPQANLSIYCQAGKSGNLAAFSDAFRYNLLERHGGWWFDADMLCMQSSDKFEDLIASKHPTFCAGFEDSEHINGAALFAADPNVAKALIDDLSSCGYTFGWGEIGPKLLTRVVARLDLRHVIEPPGTFYSIHFRDFVKLYDPAERDWCESCVSGALAVHLWNEIRSRLAIPTALLPPSGSFVHAQLTSACAELNSVPTLPKETFYRLVHYSNLEQQVNRLVDFESRVKSSFPYKVRQHMLRILGG